MLQGRVGHYDIAELLGAGGIGEVYKARDTLLDRWVAIKALRPDRLTDPRSLPRLRREAFAAAALNHPYICNVHELLEDHGMVFIVMEHVEGETLADCLVRGSLPLSDTLRFGCELAEGLAAAHAHGLVHRDVKPSNVMITAHHHVKLMDFGLAKPVATEAETNLHPHSTVTLPGEIIGTVRYMAPEQACGDIVDARSDVFALGVVMYECLAGCLPFAGSSNSTYLDNLLAGRAQPLARVASQVPSEVCAAIMRCLAHEPAERYASGRELATELRRLYEAYVSGERIDEGENKRSYWRQRSFALSIGIACTGIALAGGVIAWWRLTERAAISEPSGLEALVTWPTFEEDGRVSPDGRWSSFLSNRDGVRRIWLRRVSEGAPRPVEVPSGRVISHIWSPDSSEIACVIIQDGRAWMYVVPALFGGPPRLTFALPRPSNMIRFAGWTASGVYVEIPRPGSLWRVDLASGEVRELTAFHRTPGNLMREFAVDAGGTRVLFASNVDGREDIWLASLDGHDRRRVTDDAFGDSNPVWLGSDSFVFQSNRGGQIDLWRGSLNDQRASQVTFSSGAEIPEDASSDGKLLIFQQHDERSNLWRLNVSTLTATQLTADALSDAWPSVADDGSRVVFQRLKSKFDSLYAFQNTMLFAATLTSATIDDPLQVGEGYGAKLSPEGRWVAYLRTSFPNPTTTELWVADLTTRQTRRLTASYADPGFYQYPFDPIGTALVWDRSSALLFIANGAKGNEIRRWRPARWEEEPELLWRQAMPPHASPELAVSDDGSVVAFVADTPKTPYGVIAMLRRGAASAVMLPATAGSGPLLLLGWRNPDELLALRAAESEETATTVEVLSVTPAQCKVIARLDAVFPGSVRFAREPDTLYLTRIEGLGHGVYEYRLRSRALRRLTPPEQPGIAFAGLEARQDGWLMFSRQEVKEDIWTIKFAP